MSAPKRLAKRVAALPLIGRLLLLPYRIATGLPQASQPMRHFVRLLITSREHTNYTYDLGVRNAKYLAAFVAEVTGASRATALQCLRELQDDGELRRHIEAWTHSSGQGQFADREVRYGRRAGWYALVRILKPEVVIETGVDKGLGACVLTAALRRNAAEGAPGYYYGTDINPAKGYLLRGEYANWGRILYGDSIQSLRELDASVDLFINDSDHSADYERREYEAIASKLSSRAYLVGDNADLTDELLQFADRSNRRFLYFREEPAGHWFPGGGIGVAWERAGL